MLYNPRVTIKITTSSTTLVAHGFAVLIKNKLTGFVAPVSPATFAAHVSLTTAATSGGHYLVTISFGNSAESSSAPPATTITDFDPRLYDVYFRIGNHVPLTHAAYLSSVCTSAGLAVNAASFTAADSAFTGYVGGSVPYFSEAEYGSYRHYAQDLAESTVAYLKPNAAGEAYYQLLASPSSSDTVDKNLVLVGSFSAELESADVVTGIDATPTHLIDGSTTESASDTVAKYLNGVNKSIQFAHALQSMGSRLTALMALRSRRRATYRFEIASNNLSTVVGDDILLTHASVAGGSGSQQVKVLTVEKSKTVRIEASDLKNL